MDQLPSRARQIVISELSKPAGSRLTGPALRQTYGLLAGDDADGGNEATYADIERWTEAFAIGDMGLFTGEASSRQDDPQPPRSEQAKVSWADKNNDDDFEQDDGPNGNSDEEEGSDIGAGYDENNDDGVDQGDGSYGNSDDEEDSSTIREEPSLAAADNGARYDTSNVNSEAVIDGGASKTMGSNCRPSSAERCRCCAARGAKLQQYFDEHLEELRQYKATHGHCNVPRSYSQNKRLSRWVRTQRDNYRLQKQGKHSPLTEERIAALEGIGFRWKTTGWESNFAELQQYKVQHGHCNVPARGHGEYKKCLGQWVSRQRKLFRRRQQGKNDALMDERVAALERIGFQWSIEHGTRRKGQKSHSEEPKQQDDPRPPRSEQAKIQWADKDDDGGFEQGDWSNGNSDNEEGSDIGARCDENNDDGIDQDDGSYGNFDDEEGSGVICEEPLAASLAVADNGARYDASNANSEAVTDGRESEPIGSNCRPRKDVGAVRGAKLQQYFDELLEELRQYKAKHGHCNVPRSYSQNKRLSRWVRTQREYYGLRKQGKHSPLTEERIAALECIGFQWKTETWMTRFAELQQYKAQHGHCNVLTVGWGENKSLGNWVSHQRRLYRLRQQGKKTKNGLTDEKVAALERIGFLWSRWHRPEGQKEAMVPL